MHRVLVDEQRWLDERRFLSALNFCMLLPGPEAMQLATYVGWRLHGVKGGLAAGLLFVLPGALLMLALSMLYGAFGKPPLVAALFVGVKAAVLAIVLEALLRVASRALKGRLDWLRRGGGVRRHLLLQCAVPADRRRRGAGRLFPAHPRATPTAARAAAPVPVGADAAHGGDLARHLDRAAARRRRRCSARDHVLAQLALFFSKLAVVTFGGAYAVLAYMAQDVVEQLRLAHPRRDARRPRPRRDDHRPADPGHRVRRLPRGASRRRRRRPWACSARSSRCGRRSRPASCGSSPARPTSSGSTPRRGWPRRCAPVTAAVVGVIVNLSRLVRAARAVRARRRAHASARCACSCRTWLRSMSSRWRCRRWRWC